MTPKVGHPTSGVLHVQIQHSYRAVGLRFGLDYSMVRMWVAIHAVDGVAGLVRKYSYYDADFRLSVLERLWQDGLPRRQAAALFDIRSAGCFLVWERQYERSGFEACSAPKRRVPIQAQPPVATPLVRTPVRTDRRATRASGGTGLSAYGERILKNWRPYAVASRAERMQAV